MSAQTCDATLGCFDPDGESGSGGYCRVCTDNNTRCNNGNLETCVTGLWVPQTPACSSTPGNTCFDPAPAGGTDAYCGNCLKGADQCTPTTPALRQTCPNGVWFTSETCDSNGCYDSGGPSSGSPAAYCGRCANGDLRCPSTSTLETCMSGLFVGASCPAGKQCYDPAPMGGTDAFCGDCAVGDLRCNGDSAEKCIVSGATSVWHQEAACSWGCNGATFSCCDPPECNGCGNSLPNACGVTQPCGDCFPDQCCEDGLCRPNCF